MLTPRKQPACHLHWLIGKKREPPFTEHLLCASPSARCFVGSISLISTAHANSRQTLRLQAKMISLAPCVFTLRALTSEHLFLCFQDNVAFCKNCVYQRLTVVGRFKKNDRTQEEKKRWERHFRLFIIKLSKLLSPILTQQPALKVSSSAHEAVCYHQGSFCWTMWSLCLGTLNTDSEDPHFFPMV